MTEHGLLKLVNQVLASEVIEDQDKTYARQLAEAAIIHPEHNLDDHLRGQIGLEAGASYLLRKYERLSRISARNFERAMDGEILVLLGTKGADGRPLSEENRKRIVRTSKPGVVASLEEQDEWTFTVDVLTDLRWTLIHRRDDLAQLSNNRRLDQRQDGYQP